MQLGAMRAIWNCNSCWEAFWNYPGLIRTAHGPVTVERPGQSALIAWAIPVKASVFELGRGAAIVVFVDLEQREQSTAAILQRIYKLTPAEARLADALRGGQELASVAEQLGISDGTARTHLKAIFVKTDTSRQSQLAALLERLSVIKQRV